jgi:hypothetical protein
MARKPKPGRPPLKESERKGRLVQARVPEELDETLREAARQRRTTVSQLVRNVLESTFQLVDNIVAGTANLTQTVTRDAREIVASVKGQPRTPSYRAAAAAPPPAPAPAAPGPPPARPPQQAPYFTGVYAWQEVVLNQDAGCALCRAAVPRGHKAFVALSDDPSHARQWLCPPCAGRLSR